MDITTIDAISFATRIGNIAAGELYTLLTLEAPDFEGPSYNWFNPSFPPGYGLGDQAIDEAVDLQRKVSELGNYVVINSVDQGERLYRWGGSQGIVPRTEWADLDVAGKQAFEIFVITVRQSYLGLAVAQKALEDARRAAGVKPPPGLKLEDSIFELEEPLGKLRDEAIAAAPLMERMRREGEAAAALAAAEKATQDKAEAEAVRKAEAAEKRKAKKPEAVSAGEALAGAPQPNRGGRGRKKPDQG